MSANIAFDMRVVRPVEAAFLSDAPFAFASPPDRVPELGDCYFYHTTTIPGHGTVDGEWDLAPGIDAAEHARVRKAHIAAINNGYWLCHAANHSTARMAYGTVYAIDPAIGPVDIGVFGSILLHLRDPFLALHNAACLTRETLIVADLLPGAHVLSRLVSRLLGRSMQFKPRFARHGPWETWWNLTPALVVEFLGVLGFETTRVTYSTQLLKGRRMPMFTVVATRTKPTVPLMP